MEKNSLHNKELGATRPTNNRCSFNCCNSLYCKELCCIFVLSFMICSNLMFAWWNVRIQNDIQEQKQQFETILNQLRCYNLSHRTGDKWAFKDRHDGGTTGQNSHNSPLEFSVRNSSNNLAELKGMDIVFKHTRRIRRRASKKKGNNRKKTKKNINRKKKDNSKNNSKRSQHGVIHLQISKRLNGGAPLKTGTKDDIITYWKLPDDENSHRQQVGDFNNGTVTVKHSGLYLIYSQLTYFDRTGRWSHQVEVNNKPIMKCLDSEWGIMVDKETNKLYNTVHQCYSARAMYIQRNSKIVIRSLYEERVLHEDPIMTFWGLVKLT